MIKEIQFPIQSPFEKLTRKERIKAKKNVFDNSNDYIRFTKDPQLVVELAEACNIPEDFAKELLVIFFDEIKKHLLLGDDIYFRRFGTFYLGAGRYTKSQKLKESIEIVKFPNPKFQPVRSLKKLLSKIYG